MGYYFPTPTVDPATGEERRHASRHVTVLKVGRAIFDGRDQLCLVRNVSDHGMRVDLPVDVVPDQPIAIELRSDRILHGIVRWSHEQSSGIEFDEPVPMDAMLDNRAPSTLLRRRPRAPRFERQANAVVDTEQGSFVCRVVNISLFGARIACDAPPSRGDRIMVHVEGLPPRTAQVCWSAEDAGVQFDQPLAFGDLARWLERPAA